MADTQGLTFKNDGLKFYTIGNTTDKIFQYSSNTAWEITSSFYDGVEFSVGAQDDYPTGLTFSTDGSRLYMVGGLSRAIYQYTLVTKWNIGTAIYEGVSFSVADQDKLPSSIQFDLDGKTFWVAGSDSGKIYEYICSEAWDINTASSNGTFLDVSDKDKNPQGLYISKINKRVYIVGSEKQNVLEYEINPGQDISTAKYVSSFSVKNQTPIPQAVYFSLKGTKFFTVGKSSVIHAFDCKQWTLSTAKYNNVSFSVSTEDEKAPATVVAELLKRQQQVTLIDVPIAEDPDTRVYADSVTNFINTTTIREDYDPSATDYGYEEGTLWVNTVGGNAFILIDNTENNAVWEEITAVPPISSFVNPAVTDDDYEIGQIWVNVSSDDAFILVDNSPGAAQWEQITAVPPINSTSSPGSGDDGYDVGQLWINTISDVAYILVDNTPSNAIWTSITTTPGSITFADIQDIATDRILGRDTAGTGSTEELTLNNGLQFTGSGGIKLAEIATGSFLGRNTAATGDVEVLSIATAKSMLGLGATGDYVLRDGTLAMTGNWAFGGFNLTNVGNFTSGGITDSATGQVLVVGNGGSQGLYINSSSSSGFIGRTVTNGEFVFGGGDAIATGSNLFLYGSTATGQEYDIKFQAATNEVKLHYDHNNSTWDFQNLAVTTTGILSAGTIIATTGIVSVGTLKVGAAPGFGASANYINSDITNATLHLHSTDANVAFEMSDNTTTTTGNGPVVLNRIGNQTEIWANSARQVYLDGTQANFEANTITTTGPLNCGALTSTGIDDNATQNAFTLNVNPGVGADIKFGLTGVSGNISQIYNSVNDGRLDLIGGNSWQAGFHMELHGGTSANDNDLFCWANAVSVLHYDHTFATWNYFSTNIQTTGTFIGGQMYFDAVTEDKISLYDNRLGAANMYGFGVESSYLYSKAAGGHRWYSNANADAGVSDIMELSSTGKLTVPLISLGANFPADKLYLYENAGTTYGFGINSAEFIQWVPNNASYYTWRDTSLTGSTWMTLQGPAGSSGDICLVLGSTGMSNVWTTPPTSTGVWPFFWTHDQRTGSTGDYHGTIIAPDWNASWGDSVGPGWEAYAFDGTGTAAALTAGEGGYFWAYRAGGNWYTGSTTPAVAGVCWYAGGNQQVGAASVNVGQIRIESTTLSATNNCSGEIQFWTGGAERMVLDYLGNLQIDGDLTADSDIKLKKDLVRIDHALDKVDQLTGYTFTRIESGERKTGLIAQDVEKVLPEAVSERDDTKSLAYGHMMGLIVEAIKELRAEVKELKRGHLYS